MKTVKMFLLLIISVVATSMANAQEKKEDQVKRIVEEQNYIFIAETVNPQSGRTRQLNTSDYTFTVRKDSLASYLPYFGRAYSAPVNQSEGGIKFVSTSFDYTKKVKGDKWQITIKPKDAADVQQLYLDIFVNGSATLQVNSTNRQAISFNGYIIEGRPTAKKAF